MSFEKKQKTPFAPLEKKGTGFEPKKLEKKIPDAKKALEEIDTAIKAVKVKKKQKPAEEQIFDSCSCFGDDGGGDDWTPFG